MNLAERLSYRINNITFYTSGFPEVQDDTHIVIVPAESISSLDFLSLNIRDIPVLAYGDSLSLRKAFLCGCRDYIRTPVTYDEMYFRIIKNAAVQSQILIWKDLIISFGSIRINDYKIPINYQQFLILKLLLSHRNAPVPRESFQYVLWGLLRPESRNVDMHISSLRKKLLQLNTGNVIKTVTGFGYMIEDASCG